MGSYIGYDMLARLGVRSILRNWATFSERVGEDEVEDVGWRKSWWWSANVGQFEIRHDGKKQEKTQTMRDSDGKSYLSGLHNMLR